MENEEDLLIDILTLCLSSVPLHDLNPHTHITSTPINCSLNKPVTISYVDQLINPVMEERDIETEMTVFPPQMIQIHREIAYQ